VRRLETLRVLVAEDHPLYRKGMISLLSSVPEFEVVGEASTGEEAVARAAQLQPGVVLSYEENEVNEGRQKAGFFVYFVSFVPNSARRSQENWSPGLRWTCRASLGTAFLTRILL
jgi:hypothetical protein